MKKIYLIATIVAIITGLAVFMYATELQKKSSAAERENMVEVVVAAADIAQNSTITADMLTTALFPADTIPQTAVSNLSYLVGRIAKYPLSKGEQLLTGKVMVIGDEGNEELAERIKQGYRAFTVTVDITNGIAGFLRVGDKVDIIVTGMIDELPSTIFSLQNVSVIAIGNYTPNKGVSSPVLDYTNITLEVPAVECLILQHNIVNGMMKLVLRGFGDDEIVIAHRITG